MENIISYINNYGHRPFDDLDFNEVDSLILSQLVYSDIKYVAKTLGDPFYIRDLASSEIVEEMTKITWFPENDIKLIDLLSKSERYRDLKISDVLECEDIESEGQITACLIGLGNKRNLIIFRGTDASFAGWVESFSFSFEEEVPAQRTGKDYLIMVAEKYEGSILLAGHSKGGNLVAFAASTVDKEIQDRIERVYDLDGPGFLDEFFQREDYRDISEKVSLYIPKKSVVGLLLNNLGETMVVKGKGAIIDQHYPYNWSIKDSKFEIIPETAAISKITKNSLDKWLKTLDRNSRKDIIFSIYKLFEYSGAEDVKELVDKKISGFLMLKDSYSNMEEKEASILKNSIFDFLAFLRDSFFSYLFKR